MGKESGELRTAVAGLGWRVGRALRKGLANMRKAQGGRRMELAETLALGGRRQLMLVLCDGQRVLVGMGSDGVHAILQMREPQKEGADGECNEVNHPGFDGGLKGAEWSRGREARCN